MQNPHAHGGTLRIEDLIFGFVRLASHKYKKQPDNAGRFERLLRKHLLPLALADTPDILTEVGLGKIDEVVQHQQQRAVLKLFTKFSGVDAPEQAMTGEGFIRAIKSLNLPPPGSTDEYLLTVLEECHQLYARSDKLPDEANMPDGVLEREVGYPVVMSIWFLAHANVLHAPSITLALHPQEYHVHVTVQRF